MTSTAMTTKYRAYYQFVIKQKNTTRCGVSPTSAPS